MSFVQFEYSQKKGKIVIEGQVDSKTLQYIRLLKGINQRFYLDKVIDFFIRLFHYENQQLGSVLIILLSILSTQMVSHFFFNTMVQQGLSHLTLCGIIVFIVVFHILTSTKYRMYVIGVLEIVLGMGVGAKYLIGFEDQHIILVFLVVNSLCLCLEILRKVLETEIQGSILSTFNFESNLLIGVYVLGKILQLYYPFLINHQINPFQLIPLIVCMSVINSVKIWLLFDFNVMYLISLITSIHFRDNEEFQRLSYYQYFLLFKQDINNNEQLNTQEKEEIKECLEITLGKESSMISVNQESQLKRHNHQLSSTKVYTSHNPINMETDSIQQSINLQSMNSSSLQQLNSNLSTQQYLSSSQPYTNNIWIAFASNFTLSFLLILLIVFNKFSHNQLCIMSLGIFKALIIMLYCQHYTVIMTQKQTNSYSYLAYIISDLFMAATILILLIFYHSLQIINNNYNTTTLILHALIPFITKTLYKQLSHTLNITQSNTHIQHFFFIWILILSSRQTIVLTLQSSFPSLYFVIDTILLLYALSVILIISKVQFYQWLWSEFKKFKQMKKYKLYIIQSMRNWRFDIRQVSQTLFMINLNILFIGYVLFKPYQYQACKYETEYLIVFGSAVLIHFLNTYNNYYTQQQIDQKSTPSYSPYCNYVLLVAASAVYAAFAYLLNSINSPDYDNHKRWSLLCLLLIIFIIFTKIFGHQVYQTFPHFRSTIKLIQLILSYFLFYYPFITIFTVFYFNFNMQFEYIFYFAVAALGYLTIASIIICVFVHAILNLTEKSKRTLFLINQFSTQLKKINMKEDSQFLSMLENLYDIMDGDSEKLLEQLKSQKISKIVIHDDIDFEYDYSFVEADKKQIQHEYVKVFADNLKAERGISSRKTIKLHSFKHISTNKKLETKIQFYKQTGSLVKGSKFRKSQIKNKNQLEIKRLIQDMENVYNSQKEMKKVKKDIDQSQQFMDILASETKCRQMMHRFFHFLSDPIQRLDFSTFCLLNQLLNVNQLQDMREVFDRFISDGECMNEQGFRDFLVEQNNQIKDSYTLWKWIIHKYLFVFLMKGNDMFGYYMKRKSIQMSVQIDRIWCMTGKEQNQQKMMQFRKKESIKKSKALGRMVRESKDSNNSQGLAIRGTINSSQNPLHKYKQQSNKVITHLPSNNQLPSITRKAKNFLSPSTIYTLMVQTLVQSLRKYQQIEHQHFKLSSIKFSLSNVLCILTKLFDFTYLYTFGSIYTIYCYGIGEFTNNKHILSFMDYNYLLLFALFGVVAYIGLILYHKEEIVNGSLGVDQNQRTVTFTNFKYYTTFLLFLMGSSLSNLFITATLNSYMCDNTTNTLFNFPNNQCFSILNILQMFTSLLILLSYYPLASLIFPFSSAIDRTLQIKYKAQYEILYLQAKFLVNAINAVFNQLDFQKEELIKCVTKTIIALGLAVLFYKEKPCSVQFINTIQLRIYIGTVIINGAGVLCYFIGMKFTSIVAGVILFLYLIYSFLISGRVSVVDSNTKQNQQFDSNSIVQSIFKKQQTLKATLQKQNNFTNNEIDTASQLNKQQKICVEQLEQSQVHLQLKQTPQKFFNVQNLTTSQASISLPQKTKNNKMTLRFKKQKTLPSTSNNGQKTLFTEDHIEMIPASKKPSATLFPKVIGSKVNKD